MKVPKEFDVDAWKCVTCGHVLSMHKSWGGCEYSGWYVECKCKEKGLVNE